MAIIMFLAFQAVTADASPGDSDTTFVPVTPCRLIDTRPNVPGQTPTNVGPRSTPVGANTPVVFTAWDSGDANSTCVIPSSATAISTNTTIVNPTAASFLTLYPADAALPDASNLNYVAGQGATPNAVTTPLSPTGAFNVFNRFGTVDVIIDINGYYTKSSLQQLQGRIAELEASSGTDQTVLDRLTALETANTSLQADVTALQTANTSLQTDVTALQTKTASMSTLTFDDQPTVRFSGVNVQIVSGSGTTAGTINGTGNLIVGYNENSTDVRTGSHNLIVGPYHSYSSYGGFIAGHNNTVSGIYSSVSGGSTNTVGGYWSSVSGGHSNTVDGDYSSVSGGFVNTASSTYSSVSGGWNNTASGQYSSVSGGRTNTASNDASSVSGGFVNIASGEYSSVSGGAGNTASGNYSSVTGGDGITCADSSAVTCGEGAFSNAGD